VGWRLAKRRSVASLITGCKNGPPGGPSTRLLGC
jgi:hypothetical protein